MPSQADPPSTLSLRPQWLDCRLTESLDTQFWLSICAMEVTSSECLTEVRSLLSCRSNIDVARSLRGNEAQMFVDFLDRVSTLSSAVPR